MSRNFCRSPRIVHQAGAKTAHEPRCEDYSPTPHCNQPFGRRAGSWEVLPRPPRSARIRFVGRGSMLLGEQLIQMLL